MKKRLIFNLGLQFFLIKDLSLVKLVNSNLFLELNYFFINFNIPKLAKFLISTDILFNFNNNLALINKNIINILNFKLLDIFYNLKFENINKRFLYLLSENSIERNLQFSDKEDFNSLDFIKLQNSNIIISGKMIELYDILKAYKVNSLQNWINLNFLLTIKKNDLLYLVVFNLLVLQNKNG